MGISIYPAPTTNPPSLDIPLGNVDGQTSVNKFGRSTNVDSGVDTDIWDRANSTDDQDIWTAPTTARTHDIASTSASDTSGGAGARTIQVYGLTSWSTAEVSETITMNGTSNVATSNSYVIIHRMKVLTKGATNVNVGVITATAQTDSTVTAQINAGEGQTQMAIYGVPSTQTAYMTQLYASCNRAVSSVAVNVSLLQNPEPDTELTNFLIKHTAGLNTAGSSAINHLFTMNNGFSGPCILKVQASANANDADVSAGFDLILVDN